MLGFANVVDLLLEYRCLHTEAECALFEAETDSHDNCLSEMVDFVLRGDMSPHLEDGYSRICGSQRVSITFLTKLPYFPWDHNAGGRRRESWFKAPRGHRIVE